MLKIKQLFCSHDYKLLECIQDFDYCKDWVTFADVGMWYKCTYICKKCGKRKVHYVKIKNN